MLLTHCLHAHTTNTVLTRSVYMVRIHTTYAHSVYTQCIHTGVRVEVCVITIDQIADANNLKADMSNLASTTMNACNYVTTKYVLYTKKHLNKHFHSNLCSINVHYIIAHTKEYSHMKFGVDSMSVVEVITC